MFTSYDHDADALYIRLLEGRSVARSEHIEAGTLVDLDEHGAVVGIEILQPGRPWPIDELARRYGLEDETRRMLSSLMAEEGDGHRFRFGPPPVNLSQS